MSTQADVTASPIARKQSTEPQPTLADPVAAAVAEGLSATPKWLPAWLFYDAEGSRLFEQITVLPEYYLTRTEREIFSGYADGIIGAAFDVYAQKTGQGTGKKLRLLELGAGSASKTGILLAAAVRRQGATQYLPIDVSAAAMEEARTSLARAVQGVDVQPQIANYVTDPLNMPPHDGPTLALYIGSSVGNFAPDEASAVLRNLRAQMGPGDSLLLGTDLVKDLQPLLAAYNDREGVTAAFNLNMLRRINRDLHGDFDLASFRHEAVWNAEHSRIEMHLQSAVEQTVHIPAAGIEVQFAAGETIHTENSYKFTPASIANLLQSAGFTTAKTWNDNRNWFAVTLAAAGE
ncbi:MAG: L-histidine N(alpha)-methyltransferase [Janthinobacterium lividum]